jgi:RHS repeat-associated protein
MRFTGEYLDAETQDYHLRARQYDPTTGRFAATDPFPADAVDPWVSLYGYVSNRPGMWGDPTGMNPFIDAVTWPSRKVYDHYYEASSDGVDPDSFTGNIILGMRAGEDTADATLGAGSRALGRSAAQLTDGDLVGALGSAAVALFEIGPGGKVKLGTSKLADLCRRLADEGGSVRVGPPGGTALTTPQITDMANRLGFRKTNYRSHGQVVFTDGRRFITQDVDEHKAGSLWKMADSVRALGSRKLRSGTYDYDLNRIGD